MQRWLLLVLLACACPSKQGPTETPGGDGSAAATCEDVRARVERLYGAEATEADPARRGGWIADNTTMILNDCTKEPRKRVPCIQRAASVAELENKCVVPLDEVGTEGEELRQ